MAEYRCPLGYFWPPGVTELDEFVVDANVANDTTISSIAYPATPRQLPPASRLLHQGESSRSSGVSNPPPTDSDSKALIG